MASWNHGSTILFIDIYRSAECLWKIKVKRLQQQVFKGKAYENLVERCQQFDPSVNKDTIVKKINNNRSSFSRELKKIEQSKMSGAGSDVVYEPKLWYYDHLMFLIDQETPRQSRSNINLDRDLQLQEEGEGTVDCESQSNSSYSHVERDEVVNVTVKEQQRRTLEEELRCWQAINNETEVSAGYCPIVWDTLMCWPRTLAGEVAVQPCPNYVYGFKTYENAAKRCMENGKWYVDPRNRTWTDLTKCTLKDHEMPKSHEGLIGEHMETIRIISNVGYGISLAALLLSVCIMLAFKRLRCPRNTIHLNLFISFILRASFSFMKENLLVKGLGFPFDIDTDHGTDELILRNDSSHWECKFFFTCFHYILGANYMWICAEALYLYMLISVAVFSERGSVKWYILFGWGTPFLFVVPWVIVRAVLEDVHCWNTNPTAGYFWIMRGPIVASILVNCVVFVLIIRILFTKLNAVNSPEANRFRYRKLARSTLVLIPLFGVHYIVFAGLPSNVDPTAEVVQLYFEMTLNSIQGFLVALLFCFLNGEVKSEIKKKWHRFRLTHFHRYPKSRNASQSTMATYLSKPRESNASVTQVPEPRDLPGNGTVKKKHTRDVTQESIAAFLNHNNTHDNVSNGNGIVFENDETEPMISMKTFSSPDSQEAHRQS